MSLRFAIIRGATLAALAALGAGCGPAPQPDTAVGSPTAAAAPAPSEFGEKLLWIDPLEACGDKQVTTIHWSKEAVAKGPATIELGDVNPGTFALIGDAGEKETGSWATPGVPIVLRGSDGEVRARQVIKGPTDCGGPDGPATATGPQALHAGPDAAVTASAAPDPDAVKR